jgi:hypothetical protein
MMAIFNLVDDPSEIVLFQQEFSKEIHDNIYAILTPLFTSFGINKLRWPISCEMAVMESLAHERGRTCIWTLVDA